MLVGVPRPELCEPLAHVLQSLGVRRAMVVCGAVMDSDSTRRYLDEISPLGPTTVAEFYQERALTCSKLEPEHFELQPAALPDLRGGETAGISAEIIRRILRGEERGPKRDAVLLNAAAALFVAGHSASLMAGWDRAAEVVDGGLALRKLEEISNLKAEKLKS
jgi:anthranilate phosphoribosyltransferase